jgi:hypothetical protein
VVTPATPSLAQNRNTFGGVKATARAILGDSRKSWLTDEYLDPIVRHCFDLQILYLLDTCSPFITKVVTIPGLPIATTDLSAWQNDTQKQSLYGLMDPLRLDWKNAGAPEITYTEVRKTDILPNYSPAAPMPLGQMYFEWRRMIVYLTPMAYLVDLRVRGEFLPDPLLKEDQIIPLHPLLGAALAEESAACASRERANPGQMEAYELVGTKALDNISNALVRSGQDTTIRVGRVSGRQRGGRYGC